VSLGAAPGQGQTERLIPGVVLPIDAIQQGWAHIRIPCEQVGWVKLADGTTLSHATVVLDPGHGGTESGAVGQGGLAEKEVNLDVARRAARLLQARGIDVVLSRTDDYQATLVFRIAVAAALHASAFVSIHHNAQPDGLHNGPGTETFYQLMSPSSKRLAGLLYEEGTTALTRYSASWVGNTDAGARWRLTDSGSDYYGLLRFADQKHLTAGLAELAFISNPSEEALLRRSDVRDAEAQAVARALVRFLTTNDAGSGFSIPHPRTEPAGGGGGRAGCVDPIQP
jgi:N-acetylmuramoyl-L-alanine amidase